MTERNEWVDVAKGIGILLVVYGHVARGAHSAGLFRDERAFEIVDSVIYTFHMPLFFFLSGLFVSGTIQRRGCSGAVWSKVDTVLFPYVVWSVLQGTVQAALSNYTNDDYSFARILSIGWEPISPFWFLYVLFGIFAIALLALRISPDRAPVAVAIVTAIAYLAAPSLTDNSLIAFFTDNAVYFAVGLVVSSANVVLSPGGRSAGILLATAIAGQVLFHGALGDRFTDKNVAAIGLACVSIAAVVVSSQRLAGRWAAPFSFLGQNSMAIYVMHILAGSGTRVVLTQVGVDALAVHLALGCAVGVLAPIVALRAAEKVGLDLLSAPISTLRPRRRVVTIDPFPQRADAATHS